MASNIKNKRTLWLALIASVSTLGLILLIGFSFLYYYKRVYLPRHFQPPTLEQQQQLARLIGPEIQIEPEIRLQVLQDEPGQIHVVDSNDDGLIDVIYLIDDDERHGEIRQPLLVKIVDEDGDMHLTNEGDYDSDLYIADWLGDGIVDRVIDYVDLDQDNDVDEQYLYKFARNMTYVGWAKDYGDDNGLWSDVNYEHNQVLTEWTTDFNGDEMFVWQFGYEQESQSLTPFFEIAFSFYDHDGDAYSEEVLRFTGTGLVVNDLRYSMDIDNDNAQNQPYHKDYDFSLTALGPITVTLEDTRQVNIRGHTTEPIVKWEEMRAVAKAGTWRKIHLTWDENDNNIDPSPIYKNYERWEGVLNAGNEYMPQVGGPPSSQFNKRNEVDLDASGQMKFYYAPIDQRFHLYGAEVGWIKVDYNYDQVLDMQIRMTDTNNNGYFDIWRYDVDGDGSFERSVQADIEEGELYSFDYQTLHQAYMTFDHYGLGQPYTTYLDPIITVNQSLIEEFKKRLDDEDKLLTLDPMEQFFVHELVNYDSEYHLGQKIKDSREGTRYYLDLIRERYWHRLLQSDFAQQPEFQSIITHYHQGNLPVVAELLRQLP